MVFFEISGGTSALHKVLPGVEDPTAEPAFCLRAPDIQTIRSVDRLSRVAVPVTDGRPLMSLVMTGEDRL